MSDQYREYDADGYREALNGCRKDGGFDPRDGCDPYGLLRMAEQKEREGDADGALSLYCRSAEKGCREALWILVSRSPSYIDDRCLYDVFENMCGYMFKTSDTEADNERILDALLREVAEKADTHPRLYDCLSQHHAHTGRNGIFLKYSDLAIEHGSMIAANLKARWLIDQSWGKVRSEAEPLMNEAIGLLRSSADECAGSEFLLGRELFCGRWIERDVKKAVEHIEHAHSILHKGPYGRSGSPNTSHWMDFFRHRTCEGDRPIDDMYRRGDKLLRSRLDGRYDPCLENDTDVWNVLLSVTYSDDDLVTGIPEHRNRYGGYENDTFAIVSDLPYYCTLHTPIERMMLPDLIFKPCNMRFWMGCRGSGCDTLLCEKHQKDVIRLCIESVVRDMELRT